MVYGRQQEVDRKECLGLRKKSSVIGANKAIEEKMKAVRTCD